MRRRRRPCLCARRRRGGGVSYISPKRKGEKGRFPIQISRSGNFGKGRGSREEKETTKDEEGKATVFCFRRLLLRERRREIGGEAIVGLSPSLPSSTRGPFGLRSQFIKKEEEETLSVGLGVFVANTPFLFHWPPPPFAGDCATAAKKRSFLGQRGQDQVTARVEPEPRRKDP